eukprot:CAMPEP_0182901892 /NCGR_PEP_ID=MMETSP0034_2-20130328/30034_1 /TAXON_ID=156128 /ORGANISM="Nephroselmis pyriformis, Strain CCMP717" /LENGTH=49 /DNA_ID= /DNA_START= /DNA_END= /DNA_ORIENTATION=
MRSGRSSPSSCSSSKMCICWQDMPMAPPPPPRGRAGGRGVRHPALPHGL